MYWADSGQAGLRPRGMQAASQQTSPWGYRELQGVREQHHGGERALGSSSICHHLLSPALYVLGVMESVCTQGHT